ncbi:MAG: HD family phosphohydrolase [Bdellovibrionales bacterium CG10_big_fil_rev_8_21_14_0_10_45_34]|nr:MAG: HD family phosphohydrolase [Bdellovibrionales bacterium CG10_big_fil_rev_8_21_14_0_10_45_34]
MSTGKTRKHLTLHDGETDKSEPGDDLLSNKQSHATHMAVVDSQLLDDRTRQILDTILEQSIEQTNADGGSIYLIDKDTTSEESSSAGGKSKHILRFYNSNNYSNVRIVSMVNQILDINTKSIAGYVALTGKTVKIRDCYNLDADAPFHFRREIDSKVGYRTKSVLCTPIRTVKGAVIGVVQVVNKVRPLRRRKDSSLKVAPRKDIIAFSDNDERLIGSFATYAAIALENVKLTRDIASQFESFVQASVSAIEARDPSTSGHSDRVALLTVSFAEKLDSVSFGAFQGVKFTLDQIREIRYAALLHDFGKIGVRENILLKPKKLYPHELESVLSRLSNIRSRFESAQWRQVAQEVLGSRTDEGAVRLAKTSWNIENFHKRIEEIQKGILTANEPQILDQDFDIHQLVAWIKETSQHLGQTILTEDEIQKLSVAKGTLSIKERDEIQSHVSHTFEFLKQIAWTDDLAHVPDIAHAHHEKLDGSGYPRGLIARDIPLQSRMMTIADIYDALTAMDRPYKKAVSPQRALEILEMEAKEGKLDSKLLTIFIEADIYKSSDAFTRRRAA